MNLSIIPRRSNLLAVVWLLLGATAALPPGVRATAESARASTPIFHATGLPGPIRAVRSRAPSASELDQLRDVLGRAAREARAGESPSDQQLRRQAEDLETYLTENPTSPYIPSLRLELGRYYAGRLRVGRALEHWRAIADELGAAEDRVGKEYGDLALALYARHLLISGDIEELRTFYQAHGDRPPPLGPLGSHWERTAEKYAAWSNSPSIPSNAASMPSI